MYMYVLQGFQRCHYSLAHLECYMDISVIPSSSPIITRLLDTISIQHVYNYLQLSMNIITFKSSTCQYEFYLNFSYCSVRMYVQVVQWNNKTELEQWYLCRNNFQHLALCYQCLTFTENRLVFSNRTVSYFIYCINIINYSMYNRAVGNCNKF